MPSAPLQVEVTISSARDLKNVNWRYGPLKPYAVVWVDPNSKRSTKVDEDGDTCPVWNDTIVVPLVAPIQDSTLFIDIVHANAEPETKPLIGSARVVLREIVDEFGIGEWAHRSFKLKRPSGRPQGKLDVKIVVHEIPYRAPDPYCAPPYGVPPPSGVYPYRYHNPYPNQYSAPPTTSYPAAVPTFGYPYPYGAPPPPVGYGNGSGRESYHEVEGKKGNKFGVGTGLAVGAVAGVLGGLALAEGIDYVEDKIEDKIEDEVAERVEAELADAYGDDDF